MGDGWVGGREMGNSLVGITYFFNIHFQPPNMIISASRRDVRQQRAPISSTWSGLFNVRISEFTAAGPPISGIQQTNKMNYKVQ